MCMHNERLIPMATSPTITTHDMHKTLTSFILIFLKVACHARWNELKLDYRPTTETRSETFPGA